MYIFVIPFGFPEPYSAPATHWIHSNSARWLHRPRLILALSPFSTASLPITSIPNFMKMLPFLLQALDSVLDHRLSSNYIASAHRCRERSLRCHPKLRLLSSKSCSIFSVFQEQWLIQFSPYMLRVSTDAHSLHSVVTSAYQLFLVPSFLLLSALLRATLGIRDDQRLCAPPPSSVLHH